MRSEHRAPFVASIIVVLACIGVMAHAVRTDALGGFVRQSPMGLIAGTVLQPKPVVSADAPRPSDTAPVVPDTEASKAPARPTAPARDSKSPAKQGGAQGTPQAQDDGRSHTTVHPAADAHSAAPQAPTPKTPDAVVSSTPKPAPVPTPTPTPAAPPTSAPVPTPAPTTPTTKPGRGPGYGQGPRGVGQTITSAIATALTQALNDARDHSGYENRDDHGYDGGRSDDRDHGYDGGRDDDHRSDDHRGGRGGSRSWR